MSTFIFTCELLLTLLSSCLFTQIAWAAEGDAPTNPNVTLTAPTQFSNTQTLPYPNCGGVCAFGIVKMTPDNRGFLYPEAIFGVIAQFDSPENKSAQSQVEYYKAKREQVTQENEIKILTLLADAVEKCQDARASMFAISAAKSLMITPEQLLFAAYKQPRICPSGSNPKSSP
jgi:hypothetical protein